MTEYCEFCKKPLNPHDLGVRKQVSGWVGGQHKDSMTLRRDTGKFAHEGCVQKARAGQAPEQLTLFDMPEKEKPETWSEREKRVFPPQTADFDELMER